MTNRAEGGLPAAQQEAQARSSVLQASHQATPEPLPAPAATSQPPRPSVYPIDLPTALQLADARNPQVQFARERVAAARAQYDQSSVLWLPNLRVGASWTRHDGQLQEIRGDVFAVSRSALFSGGGAQLQADTADAFFTPLAARQVVSARAADSAALTNKTLLDVSQGYFELVRANALYAVQVGIVENVDSLDQLAQSYLRADKLKPADAGRIRTDRWMRQQDLTLARQNVRIASAQLARFVRLDPFVELAPAETEPVPLALVSPDLMQTDLAATALTNRPELAQSRALARAAAVRLRQSRTAPLLPSLLLDVSSGGFGGGRNEFFGNYDGRLDVEAGAVWELTNLGLGDRARIRERAAETRQAQFAVAAQMDQVVMETAQAAAQVDARRQQLDQARTAVQTARDAYRQNLTLFTEAGIELILPLEVLQALDASAKAQRDYVQAVIEYNQAQLQLYWALGLPTS